MSKPREIDGKAEASRSIYAETRLGKEGRACRWQAVMGRGQAREGSGQGQAKAFRAACSLRGFGACGEPGRSVPKAITLAIPH